MLALFSVLQYAQRLSDRAAADAVRSRIDWKYALGLELTDPGFHHSVLSQLRDRLIAHLREAIVLDVILERCRQAGCCGSAGEYVPIPRTLRHEALCHIPGSAGRNSEEGFWVR